MPTLFVREADGTVDPEAYRASLDRILDEIGTIDDAAERAMLTVLDDGRRSILASLAALDSDSPSAAMYRQALAGVNTATANLADTMGRTLEDYQRQGFDLGVRLALEPLDTAGFRTLTNVVTTDQLQVLGGYSAELIRGVADDVRRRATLEVTAVVVGAKTPAQAAAAIGTRIDRGVFSTVGHRARAIVVTETGRAQALAAQAAQTQLAAQVPGIRKRWINSHLPGSRETHLEAEARYAPGGEIGPIPVDAEFEVAGFRALYPRDPSLPASESVHCKCVSVTVVDDTALTAPATSVSAADDERARQVDDDREPWERENDERAARLARPLTPPDGWAKMSNPKRIAWIENALESDWPLAGPPDVRELSVTPKKYRGRAGFRKWNVDNPGRPYAEAAEIRRLDRNAPVVDFAGLTPDVALPLANVMRDLGSRYPDVAQRLRYIGTYRADKSLPWLLRNGRQFGSEVAHASRDGLRIAFSPGQMKTLDGLAAMADHCHSVGWWTTSDPFGVVVHEWGHQVANWLKRETDTIRVSIGPTGDLIDPTSPAALRTSLYSYLVDRLKTPTGFTAPSRYGAKNESEAFAEAFAAAELLEKVTDAPGAHVMIQAIKDLVVEPTRKAAP